MQALIVDDEPQSITVLKEQIHWERLGVTGVFGAFSAQEARQVMDREKIQLILCDIEMPGESGLEFIQWLREESDLNGNTAECVILTCYPEYSYMRKAMQIGCSDYLIKPVDPGEVEQVLARMIQKVQTELARMEPEQNDISSERREIVEKHLEGMAGQIQEPEDLIEQKVLPYIAEHFTQMLTVTEIAEYAALNPQYLMRLFKKRTGISVLDHVTVLRLEMARDLLSRTDWTNDIIAEKIGYASPNYFIKLFKNRFGMTPREFRKTGKKA